MKKFQSTLLGRILTVLLALSVALPYNGAYLVRSAFATEDVGITSPTSVDVAGSSSEEETVSSDALAPEPTSQDQDGAADEDAAGPDAAAEDQDGPSEPADEQAVTQPAPGDVPVATEQKTLDVTVYADESMAQPLEDAPKVTITGELPVDAEAKAYVDDITESIEGVDDSAAGLTDEDEQQRAEEFAETGLVDPLYDAYKTVTLTSLNLGLYDEAGAPMDASLLAGEVEVQVDAEKLMNDGETEVKVYAADEAAPIAAGDVVEAEELADVELAESSDVVRFDAAGAGTYAVVRAARAPAVRSTAPDPTFDARDLGIQINLFDYYGSSRQRGGRDFPFDDNDNHFDDPNLTGINHDGNRNQDRPFQFYGRGTGPVDDLRTINNYTAGPGLTGTETSSVMQGIVQNQLGADGYPVLANGLPYKHGDWVTRTANNTSLNYLFDGSNQVGKRSYMGLDGLIQMGVVAANGQFSIDSNGGYYGYNSNENYAYYGPSATPSTGDDNGGRIELHDGTYNKAGSTSDYKIGFFPFDAYNESKNQIAPGQKNHHLGLSMHATFTLPPNRQVTNPSGNMEDMRFTFSGDDDAWVFIDGVLVLDMGGIHQPAGGEINFHNGEVKLDGDSLQGRQAYSEAVVGAGAVMGNTSSIRDAFVRAGRGAEYDAWTDYSTHTIDFFYLERGSYDSNCMLAMNLAFTKATELTVDKEWSDGDSLHTASNDSVYVQLYRQINGGNREPVGEPVKLDKDSKDKYGVGPFRHTFDGLPVRDERDNRVYYTVEEGTLENGRFVAKETGIDASGTNYTLDSIEYQYAKGANGANPRTETYRPDHPSTHDAAFHNGNDDPQIGTAVITNRPSTKIEVEKQWKDETGQNADPASHDHDSVWVQLYKLTKVGDAFPGEDSAVAVGNPIELNAASGWKGEFEVPKTGENVKYIVREGTYDGTTFTPTDRIYAAKADASDVGQPYERISTSYTIDELQQKYKSETTTTSGNSQPFSSTVDYGLHYEQVNGILHRFIGTDATGWRDDGIISPFANKGIGGTTEGANDIYWSTRDLVPVQVTIPQNAATFKVTGTVSGNDYHIFEQGGQGVRVDGDVSGTLVAVDGDLFTVTFSNSYVAANKGQTVTILVPGGVRRTQQNNWSWLIWLNGRDRLGHIKLDVSGTTIATGSSTTTQVVPDGDPTTVTGIASDGGVQFVVEHQTSDNPITKATTLKGYAIIANKPLTTSVPILKKDFDTQAGMDGVKFTLYRSDVNWIQGQQVSEQTTASGGAATFSSLNDGYYVLKEEKGDANAAYEVPTGFWKIRVQDGKVTQFLDPSGATVPKANDGSYTLSNTKVKTRLTILKIDGENPSNTKRLPGASFTMKTEGAAGKYVQADGSLGDTAYEFTTGSDGTVSMQGLTAGVYWLTETKAPAGYQKLGSPIRIEISNDGTQALFYEGADQQTVHISGHAVSMTVKNSKAPDLPFAGARPQDFLPAGLALSALGVASAVYARRRRASEE